VMAAFLAMFVLKPMRTRYLTQDAPDAPLMTVQPIRTA